jgi:hypothetical protein
MEPPQTASAHTKWSIVLSFGSFKWYLHEFGITAPMPLAAEVVRRIPQVVLKPARQSDVELWILLVNVLVKLAPSVVDAHKRQARRARPIRCQHA